MGIPAYFSFIARNHTVVIKRLEALSKRKKSNFLLDCNSIIYDTVREINKGDNFEERLIAKVCDKIQNYVNLAKPTNLVYIAFDGVAPFAKMDQQRHRRYKSWFEKEMKCEITSKPEEEEWNTVQITPGTSFMKKLSAYVKQRFKTKMKVAGQKRLVRTIVSTSEEVGEGEHKLYDHMRRFPDDYAETTTLVYGLDADLIMLTMSHLHICSELYLYRESPSFIKSISKSLDPNELYILDVPQLSHIISSTLNMPSSDYTFLCFLLGNDFIPHIPAINIRSTGMDILMSTYTTLVNTDEDLLCQNGKVMWPNVNKLISALAEKEHKYLLAEYERRYLCEKRGANKKDGVMSYEEAYFNMIPSFERNKEKFINPKKVGWRERYYRVLFDVTHEKEIKHICLRYMEILEWTHKYYTMGCVSWDIHYPYMYAPLLQDLEKYVPTINIEQCDSSIKECPYDELFQLSYVLPRNSLYLLPGRFQKMLLESHADWYSMNCDFTWAFCKYFWECHVEFPEIDKNELKHLINDYKRYTE